MSKVYINDGTTLGELQQMIAQQSKDWDFNNVSIDTRLSFLACETGEVLSEVMRARSVESLTWNQKQSIGAEIYDVVWNALELASRLGINFSEEAAKKDLRNRNRFDKPPKSQRRKPWED